MECPQDVLVLKKVHRPLKIQLIDDTRKTVMVPQNVSTSEVTEIIGEKLNLRCPEECDSVTFNYFARQKMISRLL